MLHIFTPSAESRLVRYTTADFNDPTKYNRRTAQAKAIVQNQGKVGGSDANAAGNKEASAQAAQQLQAAQATYANSAAGLQSGVQQTVGTNRAGESRVLQSGVQAYGDGQIQQSAIDRLREAGKTDQEIAGIMNDPERLASIQQTMSNTGLGDQSNVIENRKLFQGVASGAPPETGKAERQLSQAGIQDPVLLAQARNEDAKSRMLLAQEQAMMAETSQKQKQMSKPNYDATPISDTGTKISSLFESVKSLTPELQAAVMPELMELESQNAAMNESVSAMIDTYGTEADITGGQGALEEYILSSDKKYSSILDKNKELSLQVAEYNKKMLEADKAIMENDARIAEQKQVQVNIDNEKKLRRQLNKLGIETDTSGLTFLRNEIQKGVDALSGLKTANNLNSLKAQLAIGEGYRLEVQKALDDHEAKHLELTNLTAERLQTVKKDISSAKEKRLEGIRDTLKWGYEQKNKNDLAAAKLVSDAHLSMIEAKEKIAAQDRMDERSDKRLAYQERMATQRMQIQERNADARANRLAVTDEKKEAKEVRKDFDNAKDDPEVKTYIVARDSYAVAQDTIQKALTSGRKIDLAVAKEVATVLYEKSLDPTSVVREAEYLRASKGQGWVDNVSLFAASARNGDLTGITVESMEAFLEAMKIGQEARRASALSRYIPALNRLSSFNRDSEFVSLDPREVNIPAELLRPEDLQRAISNEEYNFDYGSEAGYPGEYTPDDPKIIDPLNKSFQATGMTMDELFGAYDGLELMSTPESQAVVSYNGTLGELASSLAPITQSFDSQITTKNYSAKTVKAWGGTHQGLDLAFQAGAFVPSFTSGTIRSVAYDPSGWGLTVIVEGDDGAEIRYSHLSSVDPLLSIGMRVEKGREFAQVGRTGNVFSTTGGDGTHLDLRIKKNGKYIDPFTYTV